MSAESISSTKSEKFAGLNSSTSALDDWDAFLNEIEEDFDVGIEARTRFAALMVRLSAAGIVLSSAALAADYLSPIFSKDAADAIKLRWILDRHFLRKRATPPDGKDENDAPTGPWSFGGPLALVVVSIVFLVAVAGPIWWWWHNPSLSHVPPNPTPVPPKGEEVTPPATLDIIIDLLQRLAFVTPILLIGSLLMHRQMAERAKLTRRKERGEIIESYGIGSTSNLFFSGSRAREGARQLRQGLRIESRALDMRRSLKATLKSWGWPRLLRRRVRINTEVVLIVDRASGADHIPTIGDAIAERLEAAGVFFSRYEFRHHPGRLVLLSKSGAPEREITFDKLAEKHRGHRLLIVSDGEGMFQTRRGDNLARLEPSVVGRFGAFGSVVLMTPTPRVRWGTREKELAQSAAFVIPIAEENSLRDAAGAQGNRLERWLIDQIASIEAGRDPLLDYLDREYFRIVSDIELPHAEAAQLAARLELWLGPGEPYDVFAAIAAFPVISPELSLAIGSALLGRPFKLDEFSRVARLPWIRDGRMPDWLRISVLQRLPEDRLARVRDALDNILRTRGTYALPIYRAARNPSAWFRNAKPEDLEELQDRVFLGVMSGEEITNDLLSIDAPERLTKEMGYDGDVKRGVLWYCICAIAAGAFLFRDLILTLADTKNSAFQAITTLIPPEVPYGPNFRMAALMASAAAMLAWAFTAMRWTEAEAKQRVRFKFESADIYPFGNLNFRWTLQTDWLALGLLGLLLSILGLGSGAIVSTLTLSASLLVTAWVLWVRLPLAGSQSALEIDYDKVSVLAPDNSWVPNPGGIEEYPLAVAIRDDRWFWMTLRVTPAAFLGATALGAAALSFATTDDLTHIIGGSWEGAALFSGFQVLRIVLIAILLSLALIGIRKALLGTPSLPSQKWSNRLPAATDMVFSVVLVTLISALAEQTGEKGFPYFAIGLTAILSWPIFVVQLFRQRNESQPIWRRRIIISGLLPLTSLFGFAIGSTPALTIGISLAAVAFFLATQLPRRIRSDKNRLHILGTVALMISCALLLIVFISGDSIPGLAFDAADPKVLGSAMAAIAIGLILLPTVVAAYPIFRYFGPADASIEALITKGAYGNPNPRISLRERIRSNPWLIGSGWAWLATPILIAASTTSWMNSLPELLSWLGSNSWILPISPLLGLPIAVWIANRFGKPALLPISLGSVGYLLPIPWIETIGGVWPAFVIILWTRLTIDPAFRQRILTRQNLSVMQATAITIALSAQVGNGSDPVKIVNPSWALPSLIAIVALSRMPYRSVLYALASIQIAIVSLSAFLLESRLPTALMLSQWIPIWNIGLAIGASVLIPTFRAESLPTKPDHRSSAPDERQYFTTNIPFKLALMACFSAIALVPWLLEQVDQIANVTFLPAAAAGAFLVGLNCRNIGDLAALLVLSAIFSIAVNTSIFSWGTSARYAILISAYLILGYLCEKRRHKDTATPHAKSADESTLESAPMRA